MKYAVLKIAVTPLSDNTSPVVFWFPREQHPPLGQTVFEQSNNSRVATKLVRTGSRGIHFFSHKHRGFHVSTMLFLISFVKQEPDNVQQSSTQDLREDAIEAEREKSFLNLYWGSLVPLSQHVIRPCTMHRSIDSHGA